MKIRKTILKIMMGISFALFYTACGGGGGSTTSTTQNITLTGKVIDGEISGATVFLDLNRNGTLDADEPQAQSIGDGTFVLTLTAGHQAHKNYLNRTAPIVVYGGTDIRTGEAFEDYLSAIIENGSTVNVTPLTSLIAESLGSELDAKTSITLEEMQKKIEIIKNQISELLNIQKSLLNNDPIALAKEGDNTLLTNALQLHKIAKEMKKAMKGDVKNLQVSIRSTYRALAKELKKLKKDAIASGDTALTQALDTALSENEIFDRTLITNVRRESRRLAEDISSYWQSRRGTITDNDLTVAIKEIEVRIVNNSSTTSNYPYLPNIITDKTAINFLSLATFGATKQSKERLQARGIELWVNEQLRLAYSPNEHLIRTIALTKKASPSENPSSIASYLADNDTVFNAPTASFKVNRYQMSAWFETALFDNDQLRHRVAYALSQIVVESLAEPFFVRRAEGIATYMDIVTKHAFGNYKDLLVEISHSSSMGLYLTYNGSKKEQQDGTTTIYPDENYAREVMQLFTLGLNQLNLDGTVKLDGSGNSIPTYTQTDVNELSKVFTGWDLKRNPRYGLLRFSSGDVTHPLEFTAEHHDFGAKTILGKTIQSGNDGTQDIQAAIDILMAHPNVAPFISKQLIMRLTKSNPTPAYVARVATVFNDNGEGVKGDLKAVVKAILLDRELWESNEVKKFKEPLLAYTEFLRAFNVQHLPVWRTSKTSTIDIHNALYMLDPTLFLGQGPTRAFTVFNFYDNRYIPNDTTFKQQKLVAPELQIQADAMLIAYANKIGDILWRREKRAVGKKYGNINDINTLISNNYSVAYGSGQEKFFLDCSEEYAVIEKELEGSVDGHFQSLNGVSRANDTTVDSNGITNRDRALKALIEHLDLKLTGGRLSQEQKNTIFEGYKEVMYYGFIRNADDPELKIYEQIISKVIHIIVTSEIYMVQ